MQLKFFCCFFFALVAKNNRIHKVKLINKHEFYYHKLLCDSNTENYLLGWEKIADPGFLLSGKKTCNSVKFSGRVPLSRLYFYISIAKTNSTFFHVTGQLG